MRSYILGTKAVVKESGGKFFLSRAVPWTDKPAARPAKVKSRNEAFTSAAKSCKSEKKGKGGTVWGVSDYNECIGRALRKARSAT